MKDMRYIPTIGLEIHAELKTRSKMFCPCRNDPDEEIPNKNVCPICIGHPGTLPMPNMQAIRHVLSVGVAVGGTLADFTEWDRKNYFYPDIPKGYQISQYKFPLVSGGSIAGVDLERIHLEEDTASSTHDSHEKSLVNFNRAGVPLLELVTKPVIHDANTAVKFAKELQLLLRYLEAGEANMEKGEMRVEANISMATEEDTRNGRFGVKTEVKNLNSFRSVERAIASEIERQTSLLLDGDAVIQETRGWDDAKGETYSQRSKESSHDYRYFPEPDIPKFKVSEIGEFSLSALQARLPELPWEKRARMQKDFHLTDKDTAVFVESPEIADYFESIIAPYKSDAKKVRLTVNYLLTDYLSMRKKSGGALISPPLFADLIEMIAEGAISSRGAKDIIAQMAKDMNASPRKLAEEHGLIQRSDSADLIPAIEEVLKNNPNVVADYKSGKTASIQFLIGQAMKATKGAANPGVVREILLKKLEA